MYYLYFIITLSFLLNACSENIQQNGLSNRKLKNIEIVIGKTSKEYLTENYGWRNYGGKHFESTYTKFFQSYILTRKFNIDKRKLHYSALIRSNQMDRDIALQEIHKDPYEGGLESISYTLKKLNITENEFDKLMHETPKSFMNYRSLYKLILFFKKPLYFAAKIGVVPNVIKKKYFKFDY